MSTTPQNPTFAIVTCGCKVNQYESEAIAEALEATGWTQRPSFHACDLYVVNTCTVTAESDRKARQIIRRFIGKRPDAFMVVTGCSAQARARDIASIPGVDAVIGNREKLRVVAIAQALLAAGQKAASPIVEVSPLEGAAFEPMSITRFGRARAYVKIEDGCESRCAYCAIPAARGPIRSKPMADVVAEVRALTEGGCREERAGLRNSAKRIQGSQPLHLRVAQLSSDKPASYGARKPLRRGKGISGKAFRFAEDAPFRGHRGRRLQ